MVAKKQTTVRGGIGYAVKNEFERRWRLYVMLLLPVTYVVLFGYVPLYGNLIAFQDFSVRRGIMGSEWVGLKYFRDFFDSPLLSMLLGNTLKLSIYGFIAGFPIPIILALALNGCRHPRFAKTVQLITYAPYFLSTVVLCGMVIQFLHVRTGLVNYILRMVGLPTQDFMGIPGYFRTIYVISGIWQTAGYSAVIYLAALSGVDVSLQEAAIIDGANRAQRVWHIDLPSILPTVVITMILAIGNLINVGYEKVYLLQNMLNQAQSEVISTFVFKRGIETVQYSFATAVGLFNSVASMILIFAANQLAKKLSDTSLW